MHFCVIVPTHNRAHALDQTLLSLSAQTHVDWEAHVLDDGSTDSTPSLVRRHAERDARIHYHRWEDNRGGVAMNEIGMQIAIERAEAWVRLGSDDWFLPGKLALDALVLERGWGACYGPYLNFPESYGGELNVPGRARAQLLRGEFACSWANIAVRTEILSQIKARHGAFCDPRLRNMEDYLFNVRLARLSEIVWRGRRSDGRVVIGATAAHFDYAPDARYRIGWDGASNSPALRDWSAKDAHLTEIIRREDAAKSFPVSDIPEPVEEVV
jgi:glycosyltransferase involved in cell wall biosynthesis